MIANQLSQPGPITRTVRDAATLLQTLAGWDSRDVNSLREQPGDYTAALERDVSGLRIAWSDDYGYAAVDPEVVDVCLGAAREFERIGCAVDDPGFALDSPQEHFRVIFATNTYAASGSLLYLRPNDLTDYFRESMEFAATLTAADYAKALGGFDEVRAKFDALFERYDLLLSPTMAVPAFPVGEHPKVIGGRTC